MIPAALAGQLEEGLAAFLRVSFWSTTPGMDSVMEELITQPGALTKGPYVSLQLPFLPGSPVERFPEVPLGFVPHRHQELAFERLAGETPRSTLIATGTGSGKTESFLWPILDACRADAEAAGVKAILLYPMNALATDQAIRIARTIHRTPSLAGRIRAGLYIGETPGHRRETHKEMGPAHLITDRDEMRRSPPDILLTNYKMLDYLLLRGQDQGLWASNEPGTLRFLVVDELHTFDGPQGTDLACLIRRLKDRLSVKEGSLCCVGTSATLGEGGSTLRTYAAEVFGEAFDEEAVVMEHRLDPQAFYGDVPLLPESLEMPTDSERMDPTSRAPEDWLLDQVALWFGESAPLEEEPLSDGWRVALGRRLLGHDLFRRLVGRLHRHPQALDQLVEDLERVLGHDPSYGRQALLSFLSLVSVARRWQGGSADGVSAPRRTQPLVYLRLQLWLRELRRMVGEVSPTPTLRFVDDLDEEARQRHLPMVHCRECGALGWGTHLKRGDPDSYSASHQAFYGGFFGRDPQVRFLWPAAAAPAEGRWGERIRLGLEDLRRVRGEEHDENQVLDLVVSESTVVRRGRAPELSRDCPFCGHSGGLSILGFQAATLSSMFIDQLYASTYNEDKRLLVFSDAVQDAAHRAGFFGTRTWRTNLRVALQQLLQEQGDLALHEVAQRFAEHWTARLGPEGYVSTFLPPSMD